MGNMHQYVANHIIFWCCVKVLLAIYTRIPYSHRQKYNPHDVTVLYIQHHQQQEQEQEREQVLRKDVNVTPPRTASGHDAIGRLPVRRAQAGSTSSAASAWGHDTTGNSYYIWKVTLWGPVCRSGRQRRSVASITYSTPRSIFRHIVGP